MKPPNDLPTYRLLSGPDDAAFCRRVSDAIALGYELYGSPTATFNGSQVIVAQALVWPSVRASAATSRASTGYREGGGMADPAYLVAIVADQAPARTKPSTYPEPFASRMAGREKHPLGDLFGLGNFGVNLTKLAPSAASALRHAHTKQDEFVYILHGHPTLHTDEGRTRLAPGMCAGFKAGTGNGHRLVNETDEEVVYLEVGDRTPGDEGSYPDDDLRALQVDGKWKYLHKDGTPY